MRLEFKVSPAVENMDLTGTLDAEGVNVRTHDESETTLPGYDTVGCSRLQLNLVIAGALQCMNFDIFYGAP